ncbi:hypothetical protein HNR46_002386 [Haloferula luteola]|uniref:histidine kinase n=1 Tax=Haloferula luteola TaxID=595692 RepID=A0A840V2C8_9BACT|nr:histidine kinase dimerization/phospho-acceptor domain-containing protein [Haloferula luteola]MBB5352145.1 hypothetical protein [Haloferula luteola]
MKGIKSGTAVTLGTLGIVGVMAALIASAGWQMSRRVAWVPVTNSTEWWESRFGRGVAQLDALEDAWERALAGVAEGHRVGQPGTAEVAGVKCVYRIDAQRPEALWLEGERMDPAPVLGRFAKQESGWVLPDSSLEGSGFLEGGQGRLAYRYGNGRQAILLILDRAAAAEIAAQELDDRQGNTEEGGEWEWQIPGAVDLAGRERPADESVRHLSVFGPWTLKVWNRVVAEVSYDVPVLLGGFVLAGGVLLAGGWLVAVQRRALNLAARQVSFANQVSHELRTPITNLMLNADLAQIEIERMGSGFPRLGVMREEMERLSRVVENVLEFSRAERREVEVKSCDLVERVDEWWRDSGFPMRGKAWCWSGRGRRRVR